MSNYSHLHSQVADIAGTEDNARLYYIRSPQWIGYPTADRILGRLKTLYCHPPSHRMPNLLIVGETNNGKTMIARRFFDTSKTYDNASSEGLKHMSVIMTSAPTSGEIGHFYSSILNRMGALCRARDTLGDKEFQIICLIRELNIKMLIIDEIHEVVQGGPRKQRNLLNVLKNLTNEAQIPLIGLGTLDALHAVQADPQLANRFRPIVLPRWENDINYLRLLTTYEHMLPLRKKSNLAGKTLSGKILRMSEGFIGEISTIITEAACLAIEWQEERITEDILKKMEWEPPNRRKGII